MARIKYVLFALLSLPVTLITADQDDNIKELIESIPFDGSPLLSAFNNTMSKQQALEKAINEGSIDGVEKALRDGANPNKLGFFGFHPLREVVNKPNGTAMAKLLLDYKADVNEPEYRPLLWDAISSNCLEIAALLKQYGAQVNSIYEGKSLLLYYLTTAHPDSKIVKFILDLGCDVDLVYSDKDSYFTVLDYVNQKLNFINAVIEKNLAKIEAEALKLYLEDNKKK